MNFRKLLTAFWTGLLLIGIAPQAQHAMASAPTVLSYVDENLYRGIFAAQAQDDWELADSLIARLDSKLLLGHVLASRYRDAHYKAQYTELREWMENHNDHPQAKKIYQLALRKRPGNASKPVRATAPVISRIDTHVPATTTNFDSTLRAPRMTRREYDMMEDFEVLPSKNQVAYNRFRKTRFDTKRGKEAALGRVVQAMFLRNLDDKTIRVVTKHLKSYGGHQSGYVADTKFLWWGGLAAWRKGDYELAGKWFRRVAYSPYSKDEITAAASFWGWRSAIRQGDFERVDEWLEHAAEYPQTFYGLIAARVQGNNNPVDFNIGADIDPDHYAFPAAQRVLALLQVDQQKRVQAELSRFVLRVPPAQRAMFIDIAAEIGMTYYSYQASWALEIHHDVVAEAALYPLPRWQPKGGYSLNPNLLFAIMRRESSFRTKIVSPAGARGLMQVMPATASLLEKRKVHGDELNDPTFNITVAQNYVHILLNNRTINHNLFFTFAGYNAGPGNPYRWRRLVEYGDDPLLYLETIPITETRIYVHEVMRNFWMYQIRSNRNPVTLGMVAAGQWPILPEQENFATVRAE